MERRDYGTLDSNVKAVERQSDEPKDERAYLLGQAPVLGEDGRSQSPIETWKPSRFARAMWLLSWAATTAAIAVLLFSRTAPAAPAAPAPDPAALVKDLGFAKFQGAYDAGRNLNQWFGIPYAGSTAGARRWRPPVPIDQALDSLPAAGPDGAIDVGLNPDQPGTKAVRCFEGFPAWERTPPAVPEGSEACLNVGVVAPVNASNLPVYVMIHGGGYTLGRADWSCGYPGLRHTGGAFVFVAVQYRLGAFGFLSSEEVRADGTANAGLLDQRMALEFVKKHISKFGGDPERIAIAGGSAGGGSVTYQMMLYGGEKNPPFRAAIAEYPWWQPLKSNEILERQYEDLKDALGCKTLACLRSNDSVAIAKGAQKTYKRGYGRHYGHGDFYYGPSVDGVTLLGLPSREFAAGRFSPVPAIASRALWEGRVFSNPGATTNESFHADLRALLPNGNDDFFARLTKLYPGENYFIRRYQLMGDYFVNCPTTWFLAAVNEKKMPAYKLIFKAGDENHGAESSYIYGDNPNPRGVASDMKDWFFSFAIHSDPNKKSWQKTTAKPDWLSYGKTAQALTVTKTPNDAGLPYNIGVDEDVGERCNFWRENADITRN